MRRLLPLLAVALPVMLMGSALRTYWALDAQRAVYLRGRAAALAAQLENLTPALPESAWLETLSEEEAALENLVVYERSSAPELAALWEGRELFRTETVRENGLVLYRAFVPFHAVSGDLRVARIDLREDAADFLLVHAKHHLWLVLIGGVLILTLFQLNARASERVAAAERKQLEMAHLARVGELSAVLAHEIRNPLGTIKGYAQLLGEQLQGQHSGLLAPIVSETLRLEALVRDLLLYGRPAEARMRAVESGELARMLGQHAQQIAVPAGVTWRIDLPAFTLQTDPDLLEQILLNLLRNGVDAARGQPKARVNVEATVSSRDVVFLVTDSGPGFTEDALRRVFEPFFTTKASGTGLGLAVSRKLAASLGGSLEAGNAPEGGACLKLCVPIGTGGSV